MGKKVKYLLFVLLIFAAIKAYSKSPEGKGFICAYGKNKDVYEAYLFFNKKYISKYLFLEKNKFKIRQNEKRNYSITNEFINLLPFKIDKKNLRVIDTEFNRISGSCKIVDSHDKAIKFMHQLKNMYQNEIDKNLGIISI